MAVGRQAGKAVSKRRRRRRRRYFQKQRDCKYQMEITAYFFWALHDEAMRVLHDEATTQQVGAALEMLSWLRASSSQVLGRVLDIGAQGTNKGAGLGRNWLGSQPLKGLHTPPSESIL